MPAKGLFSGHSWRFLPRLPTELLSQRAVHGGNVQEGRVTQTPGHPQSSVSPPSLGGCAYSPAAEPDGHGTALVCLLATIWPSRTTRVRCRGRWAHTMGSTAENPTRRILTIEQVASELNVGNHCYRLGFPEARRP